MHEITDYKYVVVCIFMMYACMYVCMYVCMHACMYDSYWLNSANGVVGILVGSVISS